MRSNRFPRNPCPRSRYRTGAHRWEPDESGPLTWSTYLNGYAAARWRCADCGKTSRFDGRYAVTIGGGGA